MYGLLGDAKDENLAQMALELAISDEPGATTSAAIISSVSGEHPEMAVDFALSHQDAVLSLVDVASRSRYIARLATGSDDAAMPAKLENYAREYLTDESRNAVDQAIVAINTRIKSQPRVKQGVSAWLDNM